MAAHKHALSKNLETGQHSQHSYDTLFTEQKVQIRLKKDPNNFANAGQNLLDHAQIGFLGLRH
jgi:hypothetical protein